MDLDAFYRRYLARCNAHRFDELGEFVAADVEVNGEQVGLQKYGDGLAEVIELLPDFSWELRHLVVDGNWLAARLADTGTTLAGRTVRVHELAMYRIAGDRIVEVFGDLDRGRLTGWAPACEGEPDGRDRLGPREWRHRHAGPSWRGSAPDAAAGSADLARVD